MSFEFDKSFQFQFGASRYITGLYWTSEKKVIVVWIWYELPFSISSVSIYYGLNQISELKVNVVWIWYELPFSIWSLSICYGTLLDIIVKSYCRLNLIQASVFNLEHLDILRDSIRHPSKKLLSFEFDTSFRFQSEASRYITGLSRTSEKNLLLFEFSRSFCFQFLASRYIMGLNRKSE